MKKQTRRLRIRMYAEEPDVFLVFSDGAEPDAVPVIPTLLAQTYWTSHSGAPSA